MIIRHMMLSIFLIISVTSGNSNTCSNNTHTRLQTYPGKTWGKKYGHTFSATSSKEDLRPRSSHSNHPDVECGLSPATNVFTAESESDPEGRHLLEKEIE